MQSSLIQAGKTYTNKTGNLTRTVIAIRSALDDETALDVHYIVKPGQTPSVVRLSNFAAWAAGEAPQATSSSATAQ